VRISSSNAGYTMFRVSVKSTGYPLSIRQFPLHFPSLAALCVITFLLGSTTATRGQLKCDGTHAETRFRLSAKWMNPFKSAWTSVQSTTGQPSCAHQR